MYDSCNDICLPDLNFQWDTFRTLYPLMSLHDPVRFAEIVRGMIDIQVHEGTHSVFNIIC
jgi:putative alpha-1,2-mannosidase